MKNFINPIITIYEEIYNFDKEILRSGNNLKIEKNAQEIYKQVTTLVIEITNYPRAKIELKEDRALFATLLGLLPLLKNFSLKYKPETLDNQEIAFEFILGLKDEIFYKRNLNIQSLIFPYLNEKEDKKLTEITKFSTSVK